jgi:hypothetical protein
VLPHLRYEYIVNVGRPWWQHASYLCPAIHHFYQLRHLSRHPFSQRFGRGPVRNCHRSKIFNLLTTCISLPRVENHRLVDTRPTAASQTTFLNSIAFRRPNPLGARVHFNMNLQRYRVSREASVRASRKQSARRLLYSVGSDGSPYVRPRYSGNPRVAHSSAVYIIPTCISIANSATVVADTRSFSTLLNISPYVVVGLSRVQRDCRQLYMICATFLCLVQSADDITNGQVDDVLY